MNHSPARTGGRKEPCPRCEDYMGVTKLCCPEGLCMCLCPHGCQGVTPRRLAHKLLGAGSTLCFMGRQMNLATVTHPFPGMAVASGFLGQDICNSLSCPLPSLLIDSLTAFPFHSRDSKTEDSSWIRFLLCHPLHKT
jgi:hypothetical protein